MVKKMSDFKPKTTELTFISTLGDSCAYDVESASFSSKVFDGHLTDDNIDLKVKEFLEENLEKKWILWSVDHSGGLCE